MTAPAAGGPKRTEFVDLLQALHACGVSARIEDGNASQIARTGGALAAEAEVRHDLAVDGERYVLVLPGSERSSAERDILEAVATGASTGELLTRIARQVELATGTWRCSVMVADHVGEHLDMAVAPSFPPSFIEGCQGVRVGERGGACGLAAALRHPVISADVTADPAWQPFVNWVTDYGVRSAWSTPLIDRDGAVLGTFALYGASTGAPDDAAVATVDRLGHLATLVLARDRVQRALTATVQNLAGLVDASPAAMVAIDTVGVVRSWNRAAERLFGWTADEVVGRPMPIIPPDDRDEFRERTQQALAGHHPPDIETRRLTRDGRLLHVHLATAPLRGEAGEIAGTVAILTDISDRKESEVALTAALDRERAAVQHLQEVGAAKNAFLAAVSHDLRTPLTGILGFAQTLERLSEDRADLRALAMDKLLRNARKLQRLLNDLLDVDRLAQGQVQADYRPTDLAALVRDVVGSIDALEGRPVEVLVEDIVAEVDAGQIERVLENLLLNAVRHTPRNCPLWVTLEREDRGGLAHLTVADAGPGVPEDDRLRLFEPFQQGAPTPPSGGLGVGIGLSLVVSFTRLHGGQVWVDERPGGGAAFHVLLPVRATAVRLDR